MDSNSIRIIFFQPEDNKNVSEEMQQAFEACKQNGIKIEWATEKQLKSLTLNKTDIIVFEKFEGTCFSKVKGTNSVRIVGPWCLLICLTQGIQIPVFPWPVYNLAMNGCFITTSALSNSVRTEIQTLIQNMAGYYCKALVSNCTHLVTDSVKSEKYIKAAENGIKIMLPSWVHDVWEANCGSKVNCNNDQFINKHRCPTFNNLVICCTGLNMIQRTELSRLIQENGGIYKEQLHLTTTDILICNSGAVSNKYLAAKKRNIKCLNIDWVKDSVKNGYAMPDSNYTVNVSTSTPIKDTSNEPPNFSMISHIANATEMMPNTTIEGTLNVSGAVPHSSKKRKSNNEHNELVDEINMQNVKMAGPFLDGCGIYFAGFGSEQREKLCKILNFGGATRYDDICDRVTHVIVGDASCYELKLLVHKDKLKNVYVLNVQWLLDSLVAECPINEEKYIITAIGLNNPDSPLSKKGLHVLQQNNHQEKPVFIHPSEISYEIDIVKQYIQNNEPSREDTLVKLLRNGDFDSKQENVSTKIKAIELVEEQPSSAIDDSSSNKIADSLFAGKKFIIVGFTEETFQNLKEIIEDGHGDVMTSTYKGVSDYAVVPAFSNKLLKKPATEIVTDAWITECCYENEIRPIEYYHKPISIKEGSNPLKGCVITLSNYVNYERNFLGLLITELGGLFQERLSKITCTETQVVASTHLVTPDTIGKKYAAAIKWKIFITNKDWLLECARTFKREPESLFFVGATTSTTSMHRTTNVQLGTPFKTITTPNIFDATKPKTLDVQNKSVLESYSRLNQNSSFIQSPITNNALPPGTIQNEISNQMTHLKNTVSAHNNLSLGKAHSNDAFQPGSSTSNKENVCNSSNTTLSEAPPKISLFGNTDETPEKFSSTTQNDISSQNIVPINNNAGPSEGSPVSSTTNNENIGIQSYPITPVHRILSQSKKEYLFGNCEKTPVKVVANQNEVTSQVTPVQKILAEAKLKNLLGTPKRLPYPKPWDHVDTPDTPLGAFIRPNPSPNLRKEMQRYLNTFPDKKPRRDSTPLSELKRKLWDKICPSKDDIVQPDFDSQDEEVNEVFNSDLPSTTSIPENVINDKLQQLHDMVTSSGEGWDSSKSLRKSILPFVATEVKDSQPSTIGWDDDMECNAPQKLMPIFMFTGMNLEERQSMTVTLKDLGASVEENPTNPNITHLICPKPNRNEKILTSMAAGRWILHPSYVDKCLEAGKFVDEERYEYGNPKSVLQGDKENERFGAIHYWRKEISRRGYGPFYDMKAIVVSKRRDALVNILRAGGAMVVDAEPPFTERIHVTHCILDPKDVTDISLFIPLAKRGIYCVNVIFVNDYLQRTTFDAKNAIIPELALYY